jgi:hypothetical protein
LLNAPHAQAQLAARNILANAICKDPRPNALAAATAIPNVHDHLLAVAEAASAAAASPSSGVSSDVAARALCALSLIAEASPDSITKAPAVSRRVLALLSEGPPSRTTAVVRSEAAAYFSRLASSGGAAGVAEVVKCGFLTAFGRSLAKEWVMAPQGSDQFRAFRSCLVVVSAVARSGSTSIPMMTESGTIAALLQVVAARNAAHTEDAVSLLYTMSASAPGRAAIVASKGHTMLAAETQRQANPNIVRKIVALLGNLCVDDPVRDALEPDAVLLVDAVHDVMSANAPESPVGQACVKFFVNFLGTPKSIAAFRECGGISTVVGYARQCKEEATRSLIVLIISNLLTENACVKPFVAERAVEMLVGMAKDPKLAVHALRAISNMCTFLDEPR